MFFLASFFLLVSCDETLWPDFRAPRSGQSQRPTCIQSHLKENKEPQQSFDQLVYNHTLKRTRSPSNPSPDPEGSLFSPCVLFYFPSFLLRMLKECCCRRVGCQAVQMARDYVWLIMYVSICLYICPSLPYLFFSYSFLHSFISSFMHSFIDSLIHWFSHSFRSVPFRSIPFHSCIYLSNRSIYWSIYLQVQYHLNNIFSDVLILWDMFGIIVDSTLRSNHNFGGDRPHLRWVGVLFLTLNLDIGFCRSRWGCLKSRRNQWVFQENELENLKSRARRFAITQNQPNLHRPFSSRLKCSCAAVQSILRNSELTAKYCPSATKAARRLELGMMGQSPAVDSA